MGTLERLHQGTDVLVSQLLKQGYLVLHKVQLPSHPVLVYLLHRELPATTHAAATAAASTPVDGGGLYVGVEDDVDIGEVPLPDKATQLVEFVECCP